MTKIHILHSPNFTPNENGFLAPLKRSESLLKKSGIELFFFSSIQDTFFDADIIFLSSKFFSPWWRRFGFEQIKNVLLTAKERANQVFWFDLADSTGTTHFKVLPYVDKYIKSQILKDKTQYQQKYYGMRITTDFYHHQFNIDDEAMDEPHLNIIPNTEELNKIQVGWNSGLCYYGKWRHYIEPFTWRQQSMHKLLKPRF
ncbi:MAG: hypothetical protein KDH94_00560 [Coxiellaceae bacterium]|nr:hypothetical protein [Coxiellaceae bacterium]